MFKEDSKNLHSNDWKSRIDSAKSAGQQIGMALGFLFFAQIALFPKDTPQAHQQKPLSDSAIAFDLLFYSTLGGISGRASAGVLAQLCYAFGPIPIFGLILGGSALYYQSKLKNHKPDQENHENFIAKPK